MKKDNKDLNKLLKFNILGTVNLFILKIIDIELTRYALSTGRATEINPIGVFMFKQNDFILYFVSLLPLIALSILLFYCYITKLLILSKIVKVSIIFLNILYLIIAINGVYQLLFIIEVL